MDFRKPFAVLPLILTLCFSQHGLMDVSAQITKITGSAKGAENKKIILKTYADLFSLRTEKLSEAAIDSNGNFSLSCWLAAPVYALFEIEYFSGGLYLQPGGNYKLKFTGIEFSELTDMVNHRLEPSIFGVRIDSCDSGDINRVLSSINEESDQWLEKNIRFLRSKKSRLSLDSLQASWDSTYNHSSNNFIRDFARYRMASLKYQSGYASAPRLIAEYYYRQAILYENPEYATLLSDIFSTYFFGVSNRISASDFYIPVNTNKSFREFADVMGKDTLLINEIFREVVALNVISHLYLSRDFNQDALGALLQQVSENSKFEKHKKIAANILYMKTRNKAGSAASDFKLKGDDGKEYSLSDFRGKALVIAFFTTWCTSCLGELEVMRTWHSKYGEKLYFLAVSADREYMKMYHFSREKKYPFLLLHTAADYDLLQEWDVCQYPHFVFVNENGSIIKNPLPLPSAGGELWIRDYISR